MIDLRHSNGLIASWNAASDRVKSVLALFFVQFSGKVHFFLCGFHYLCKNVSL